MQALVELLDFTFATGVGGWVVANVKSAIH
jgi:hypothetical protein